MTEPASCPQCGAPLPNDAPAGVCPKCLVQAGFESKIGKDQQPASGSNPAFQPTLRSPIGSGFEPPSPEELVPLFPQLEILELLGKGGMGAVYKARQRGLDRLVAVKILPSEIGHDATFSERFAREARALAKFSHPGIVAVYDFGQAGGLCYIVMEYVDGANLRQTIQAGGLTSHETLAIVTQICEALQFAHDEGIVHRDIKPENILIDKRGRVKIADFGLAKLLGQAPCDQSLTGKQQVMGTLRYMAPEQCQGSREVDHRADIYSLGVVFYELLTGELPIGRFAPPSQKVHVDVRLDEVVLRTLETDPGRRYQHASDVRIEVESIGRTPLPPENPSLQRAASVSEVDRESVRRQLNLPMIGIMASAIVNCAFTPLVILWIVHFRFYSGLQAPILAGIALLCSCTVVSVFALTGAGRMRRLEDAKLAVIGAIASMLPFTPGFVLGLPFGIWALVLLSRAEVLACFRCNRD